MPEVNFNVSQRKDFGKIKETAVDFTGRKEKINEMNSICILCEKAGVIFFKGEYLCLDCISDIKNYKEEWQ